MIERIHDSWAFWAFWQLSWRHVDGTWKLPGYKA